jgi:putative transposase
MMRLVEKHLIRKSDPRFAVIDRAAFASKNLYNQANYQIRQAYIHEGKYLPYTEIFHRLKTHEAYCALPRKVNNSILIQKADSCSSMTSKLWARALSRKRASLFHRDCR